MYGSSDSCPYVDGRLLPMGTDKDLKLVLTNRLGEIKIVDIEGSSPQIHKVIRDTPCRPEQGFRCRVEVEGFLSDNKTLACSAILLSDDMGSIVFNLCFRNDSVAQWIIGNKNLKSMRR